MQICVAPRSTFLRFSIWAMLNAVATATIGWFAPHRAIFVPGLFMVILYPIVLMPLPGKRLNSGGGNVSESNS